LENTTDHYSYSLGLSSASVVGKLGSEHGLLCSL
jgi:hypothetical protein